MKDVTAVSTAPSGSRRPSGLSRLVALFFLSIPAAAATVWDEVLLAGPIVFLTEILGFTQGLVVFVLIWAALGIAALVAVDFVWPFAARLLRPLTERLLGDPSSADDSGPGGRRVSFGVAAGGVGLVAAVTAGPLVVGTSWVADHQSDILLFCAVAVVIFVIVVIVDRVTQGLETWVRGIADTAGPTLRWFAALVTMVILGPVLGWPIFRLLRYSRGSTYGLTLGAAPVFGILWVPFYSLGLWSIVTGVL